MAIYSPLRSRRLAAQQTEATQRLITFKLGEENFALPLDRVQKVTTLDLLYADPQGTGVSLTTYQDREILVIDVGHRIFGKPPQVWLPGEHENSSSIGTNPNLNLIRYLLILKSESSESADPLQSTMPTADRIEDRLVGLRIDSPPSIQSMPLSAFQPLSDLHSHLHCVSAMSNVVPVNALLRRRAFRVDGASLVQTDEINAAPEVDRSKNRPSIFLLDATSIVRG
jgi:chemotaxis signal transduction protein